MEAAKERKKQIQYFKHNESALVDFAKRSIDETLLKQASLKDVFSRASSIGKGIMAIPAAITSTAIAKRRKVLPALGGIALGGLTGAAKAPFGYKTKAGLIGAAAGGVGGAIHSYGMAAGPVAGFVAGSHYKKKAEKSIRKRALARKRAAREAIGSTYMF